MTGIAIVVIVLIVIIAVLIIHANNKHSGIFRNGGGGLPKMGQLFLKWGGLNPSMNYGLMN